MNISRALILFELSIEMVDWHLLSTSAIFTLFVLCVLNNKTKDGWQSCTTDDGIITVVTISLSASVFLMTRSLVWNQLLEMVKGMKRGEETSTNENV
jgi:hypothetical protein